MRCAKQPSTRPSRTQKYGEGGAQAEGTVSAVTKQIAKRESPKKEKAPWYDHGALWLKLLEEPL